MPFLLLAFLLTAAAPAASAECGAPAVAVAVQQCNGGERAACVATLDTMWAECQALERRQGFPFPRFNIEGVDVNGPNVPGVVMSLRMANGLPTFPELAARSSGVERDARYWTTREDNGRAYSAAYQRCRAQGTPGCGDAPAAPEAARPTAPRPEPSRDVVAAPTRTDAPATPAPQPARTTPVPSLADVRFDADRPVVGASGGFAADGGSGDAGGGGPDRSARQVGEAGAALRIAADGGAEMKADAQGRLAAAQSLSGAAGGAGAAGEARTAPGALAAAAAARPDLAAAAGLRVVAGPDGRPVLLTTSGGAPTPAQVAPLQAILRAQTSARPEVATSMRATQPQRFSELKAGYADPALRGSVFKDAALDSDKDEFLWQKDCERVSGACNAAAEDSYSAGDAVSEAELRAMWAEVSAARPDMPWRGGIGDEARRRSSIDRFFSRVRSWWARDAADGPGRAGRFGPTGAPPIEGVVQATAGGDAPREGGSRVVEAGALSAPADGRYGFALAALLTVMGAAVAHFGWLRRES